MRTVTWLVVGLACQAPAVPFSTPSPAVSAPPESVGAGTPLPPDESWRVERAALFDRGRVHDLYLTIAPEGLAALAEAPDVYVPARFAHDDDLRVDIGLRLKGNNSFRDFTGKPAFRVRFGAFGGDGAAPRTAHDAGLVTRGRYAGLDRLVLNNMVGDPAQGREVVAWQALADAGFPAPEVVFARVFVNGECYGLYAMVEALDAAWMEKHGDDGTGDLWEANDDADLTASGLAHFELAGGQGDETRLAAAANALADETRPFLERVAPTIDTEELLGFLAWNNLLGTLDGYPYNLDDLFLFADARAGGRLRAIPWGLDESWNPAWGYQWGRGVLSVACNRDRDCRVALLARLAVELDRFEALDLPERARTAFALTDDAIRDNPRVLWTPEEVVAARAALVTTVAGWPATVRASAWPLPDAEGPPP